MKTTIDKAGRVVIPKQIRERYHMHPGTELDVEIGAEGIFIKVGANKPSLIRKQGILVHHGPDAVTLDLAAFINQEREHRNADIAGESSTGYLEQ